MNFLFTLNFLPFILTFFAPPLFISCPSKFSYEFRYIVGKVLKNPLWWTVDEVLKFLQRRRSSNVHSFTCLFWERLNYIRRTFPHLMNQVWDILVIFIVIYGIHRFKLELWGFLAWIIREWMFIMGLRWYFEDAIEFYSYF